MDKTLRRMHARLDAGSMSVDDIECGDGFVDGLQEEWGDLLAWIIMHGGPLMAAKLSLEAGLPDGYVWPYEATKSLNTAVKAIFDGDEDLARESLNRSINYIAAGAATLNVVGVVVGFVLAFVDGIIAIFQTDNICGDSKKRLRDWYNTNLENLAPQGWCQVQIPPRDSDGDRTWDDGRYSVTFWRGPMPADNIRVITLPPDPPSLMPYALGAATGALAWWLWRRHHR